MGIPKFYRWLSERYPLINQKIEGPVCPEFDALYLDMNAIFHNCSHGDEVDKYTITKEKMFCDIFKYISYLVELAKPTQFLYLAVDGVAPRAKQNQQRQRRFVSAQEAKYIKSTTVHRQPKTYEFDSNTITPGTPWMEELSQQLELYIRKQLSENDLWRNLTVLYSDHLVPGEGEHKIMQHIRHCKMQKDYNPNTRHCIYGLDADLIILSLVSHEMHFALLREEIIFALHEQEAHQKRIKRRLRKENDKFQLLHITVLRNYLYLEFSCIAQHLSFPFSFERIIDDFVFISMFVGNDFLPHLPTVNITTGGMEGLFEIYKQVLPTLDGYMIEDGVINISRFKLYCKRLAVNELSTFVAQYKFLISHHERAAKYSYYPMRVCEKAQKFRRLSIEELQERVAGLDDVDDTETQKRFRAKYYNERWTKQQPVDRKTICLDYIRALQWVINYYYYDCCSWSYYYPHHYAPLLSDIEYIEDNEETKQYVSTFEQSTPYKPFEQLLAVLPIASNRFLPAVYRDLMEKKSSILHTYYPLEFTVDMNLSATPWEGIALLPFIPESDIRAAIALLRDDALTKEEGYINSRKEAIVFRYSHNKSLKKNRIKGPIGFGPNADSAVSVKYILPCLDDCGGRFIPDIPAGAKMIIRGSPHLAAIPFITTIEKVPVRTFGIRSKHDTLVLKVIDTDARKNMNMPLMECAYDDSIASLIGNASTTSSDPFYEDVALGYLQTFLTHPLYVGWPYFREAQLSEIQTRHCTHSIVYLNDDKTHTVSNDHTKTEQNAFNRMAGNVQQKLVSIFGVDVGEIHILIKCRMLWGMMKRGDKIIKQWREKEDVFPIQICICGTSKKRHDNIGRICDDDDTISSIYKDLSLSTSYTTTSFHAQYAELVIDDRYLTRRMDPEPTFAIGEPVMYIGSQKTYYGFYGRITSAPRDGYIDIRVLSRFAATDFPSKVLENHKPLTYYSLHEVSRLLSMDYQVLSRICAQVNVSHRPKGFDVGLNLKLFKKKLLIAGYCKAEKIKKKTGKGRNNTKKEVVVVKLSQKAVDLIRKYKSAFPELFKVLDCKNYSNQFYADEFCMDILKRLCPHKYQRDDDDMKKEEIVENENETETEEIVENAGVDNNENYEMLMRTKKTAEGANFLQKVVEWIKEKEVSKLPFINFESKVFSSDVMKRLEEEADRYYKAQIRMPPKAYHLKRVPIAQIYTANPEVPWSPSEKDSFELGNRVSILRSDEGLPFGTQGTVVGIHDKCIEIVTDCNVIKGGTLHNRCSDHRGVILPFTSVINLTPNMANKSAKNKTNALVSNNNISKQHQNQKKNKNRNQQNKRKQTNVQTNVATNVANSRQNMLQQNTVNRMNQRQMMKGNIPSTMNAQLNAKYRAPQTATNIRPQYQPPHTILPNVMKPNIASIPSMQIPNIQHFSQLNNNTFITPTAMNAIFRNIANLSTATPPMQNTHAQLPNMTQMQMYQQQQQQ